MALAIDTRAVQLSTGGVTARNREALETLHRAFSGPFTIANAATALDVDPATARRQLGYFARRGWLSRVVRGLYITVPLDAARSGEWIEDPWIVAATAYRPCYIGGWSACEHWDLTEQIFRSTVVVTSRAVRGRNQEVQGLPYLVTSRPEALLFGTGTAWHRDVRVPVSDPSRTVVDILDDPTIGGGIRHISGVIGEYLRGEHRDDQLLLDYGDRLGNRTVFKRLGWLLEHHGIEGPLLAACRRRRSSGLTRLDPSVRSSGRIVRRWNLRVNVELGDRTDDW